MKVALLVVAVGPLLGGCGGGPPGGPPLVLLVSSDTLRADRLGAYGSERGLTPTLDRLAAQSVVFERAYAPSSFTVPSMSAVLSGRYPTQNAILSNEHALPRGVTTLARELRGAGYATGAVVSNWVLRSETGLDRGFEVYDDEMRSREVVRRDFRERAAPDTTRDALAALDRLREGGRPVFLWVHYQDPHGPYTPPDDLLAEELEAERGRPGGERELPFGEDHRGLGAIPNYQRIGDERRVERYTAAYHAEIRYEDRALGELLDGLERRGLAERALIVFVADHGEGLGEGEYWFAHGEYLSDPLVRVPLFVRLPGVEPSRRDDVVALVDLMPTLLARCGVEAPAGLVGRDLFAADGDGASTPVLLATLGASSVPRFGLVDRGHKYVVTLDRGGRVTSEELYRLGDEGENLAPNDPRTARMRRELQALIARMGPGQAEVRQDLGEEERRALDALGYGGGRGD